jgi:hypothetical protein
VHDVAAESMLVVVLPRRLNRGAMLMPSHAGVMMLQRRLGHDAILISSYAGVDAAKTTWLRCSRALIFAEQSH